MTKIQLSSAPITIKYGGSILEDSAAAQAICRNIASAARQGAKFVLVHGGGKSINRHLEKAAIVPIFKDGLRVTDSATIEITEMVLSGKVCADIAVALRSAGASALGLNGRAAGIFKASQRAEYGYVGKIEGVDSTLIRTLLDEGCIPVVSPIASGAQEIALNINADEAASAMALMLCSKLLIYLTDVPGILIDGKVQSELSLEALERLQSSPDIKGGMIPKLSFAKAALEGGVERVVIASATEPEVISRAINREKVGSVIFR